MSKNLTILFAVIATCPAALFSQMILPVEERVSLLGDMQAVINNTEAAPQTFADIRSPFLETQPEVAEVLPRRPLQADEPGPALPQTLSDDTALQLVSQQFKPLGSLVLGSRGILQLANGTTIEQGAKFKAQIQGQVYEVSIESVTQSGYTLRLGSAALDQTFSKK